MNEATATAQVLNVLEISALNKFALAYGYVAMVVTIFLAGFSIAKILDRKRKGK